MGCNCGKNKQGGTTMYEHRLPKGEEFRHPAADGVKELTSPLGEKARRYTRRAAAQTALQREGGRGTIRTITSK